MNKKLYYLATIPFFGMFFLVWILWLNHEKLGINFKKYSKYCLLCGLFCAFVGVAEMLLIMLAYYLTRDPKVIEVSIIVSMCIDAYLWNLITFRVISKNWNKMQN